MVNETLKFILLLTLLCTYQSLCVVMTQPQIYHSLG